MRVEVGFYVADSVHNSPTDATVLRSASLASEIPECGGGDAEQGGGAALVNYGGT